MYILYTYTCFFSIFYNSAEYQHEYRSFYIQDDVIHGSAFHNFIRLCKENKKKYSDELLKNYSYLTCYYPNMLWKLAIAIK